jgi:homogentisate 1,2-dioxygenase
VIDYRTQGRLPAKPHTVFRGPDGAIAHEHCFTRDGFDGPFAILYHQHPPQAHGEGESVGPLWPTAIERPNGATEPLRRRHLRTQDLDAEAGPWSGRRPLLFNDDLTIGVVKPTRVDEDFFSNGDGDDCLFILDGGGTLISPFGRLEFGAGDYLVVPRAVVHRFELNDGPQQWLWMECRSGLRIPNQYRNTVGQLCMDAPYSHRDFRSPVLPEARETEECVVVTKRRDRFTRHRLKHSPLDVLGWDGLVYPFVFPISRFSAKAGQVHLPPTVHGTFATGRSLLCSFVPRAVDFGDGAIPCPYPHSNVDVDEVLFYCDGDFTSRRGIDAGSMSFHPAGVPHGPHPGAYEASIGVREVAETAVMIDTFQPLKVTALSTPVEATSYDETWF